MDEFKGILNLLFWFLIYWFIFRKKKPKTQTPKPKPSADPMRREEPLAPPRTAGGAGREREAVPEPGGRVPPTIWDDLRKMLEGEVAGKPPPQPGRKQAPSAAPIDVEPARPREPAPAAAVCKKLTAAAGRRRRNRRCRFPELSSAASLRRAFLIAEVLGPPVTMRRKRGIKRLI